MSEKKKGGCATGEGVFPRAPLACSQPAVLNFTLISCDDSQSRHPHQGTDFCDFDL
jgi:hypothetical protein